VATGYHGIIIHALRDNARLGILVAVELQVFPWQRALRQTVAANAKFFREMFRIPAAESNGIGLGFVRVEYLNRNASFTQHRIGRFVESAVLPYTTVAMHFICECSHETAVGRVR
jgi:hypothetical protein